MTQHVAQCLNYLRASGLTLCLLANFQKPKVEWRRLVLAFQIPEPPEATAVAGLTRFDLSSYFVDTALASQQYLLSESVSKNLRNHPPSSET